MLSIKDMVKGKQVAFVHFRSTEKNDEGVLVYRTECGFEFPVPIKGLGVATMLASDKALLFMRYIRKERERLDEEAAMIETARRDFLASSPD